MTTAYCTAVDLIAHANKARLLTQLASNDYGDVPSAEEVQQYFFYGTFTPEKEESLTLIKARVEQAIEQSASEIDGYLALCAISGVTVTLPGATLATANMDMALCRLFDKLDDKSVLKQSADRWITLLDKLATGKIPTNKTATIDASPNVVSLGAVTVGDDLVWTTSTLDGY